MDWLSQSADLNPIEMLWKDLNKIVYARFPNNVTQLNEYALNEWPKIKGGQCKRLMEGYPERLREVIEAKGGSTRH